jgi:hypothetical protein
MKISFKIIILLILIAVIGLVIIFSVNPFKNDNTAVGPHTTVDELKSIITTSSNPEMREKGVIRLSQVAIERYETNETINFLKDVISKEKNENVRRTELASIGLMRSVDPLPLQGEMKISIKGEIRKEVNLTIFVDMISKTDQKRAIIGIPHLNKSIDLLSPQKVMIDLTAGRPTRIRFDVKIHQDGKYVIPVMYIFPFDAYDYEKQQQRIFLTVDESNGSHYDVM